MNSHDWEDLNFDYILAKQLNQIDQNKEEQTYKNMLGSSNGKNRK